MLSRGVARGLLQKIEGAIPCKYSYRKITGSKNAQIVYPSGNYDIIILIKVSV